MEHIWIGHNNTACVPDRSAGINRCISIICIGLDLPAQLLIPADQFRHLVL